MIVLSCAPLMIWNNVKTWHHIEHWDGMRWVWAMRYCDWQIISLNEPLQCTVHDTPNNITDTCWSNGGRRSLSLHVHVDCGSFQLLAKSVGGDRKQLSQLTLPGIHCAQTQAMAPSLCQRDIKYNNCLSALHHPASHQLKGNTPPERQETFLRPPLIKPDTLSIPFPCVNAGCLIGIWADSG